MEVLSIAELVAVILVGDVAEIKVGVSDAVTKEGVPADVLSIAKVVAVIVVDAAEVIVGVSEAVTMEGVAV